MKTIQQSNKEIIITLLSETDNGNIDFVTQCYSDAYIEHNNSSAKKPGEGIEGIKMIFQVFKYAFPDTTHIVEDIIAEGDKVAARITFRGTFTNPLFNYLPTGKCIESTGTVIYRIQNGKITEKWGGISALEILDIHLMKHDEEKTNEKVG